MSNLIDLSNKRFGHWVVIERDNEVQKKNIYWKCKCDCGTIRSVAGTSLRSGISTSCGCEKDKKTSERTKTNIEDLTGKRFGAWTVLYQDLSENTMSKRGARWICKCNCGTEKSVLGYSLRFGRTKSCGHSNGSSTIIDLTGRRFGKLVAIKQDKQRANDNKIKWICKCDCGKEVSVNGGHLRSGQTQSCGCSVQNKAASFTEDITGQVFGKWTVIKKDKSRGTSLYVCKCECGTVRSVSSYNLRKGLSRSCGCAHSIPKNDITGQRFGSLYVIGIDKEYYGRGIWWKCRCDCGNEKSYRTNTLIKGNVISCGCKSRDSSSQRRFIDITNKRFGRLIAIAVDHKEYDNCGNTDYYWKCKCDCGNIIIVQGTVLRRGDTRSCGCLQKEVSAERAKERTIDLSGQKFGFLTVLNRVDLPGEREVSTWRCVCDCGNEKLADGYYLRKGVVASCGCLNRSKYEQFVLQYFEEKNYESPTDFESQKRYDDLRGYGDGQLSYDFAVYKDHTLYAFIECQGQQHYKPIELFGGEEQFAKQQLHDEIKEEYANKLHVPIIIIPYTVVSYQEVKKILVDANI